MSGRLARLLRGRGRHEAPPPFSLRRLARENPALAHRFLWRANPMLAGPEPLWLHLGCGDRVLDGFANVDFLPHDARVTAWDLLDPWPDALAGRVQGVFSEDVLEHFFLGEQAYVLCSANRALHDGGVARTLMPSLARLVDYRASFAPTPDEPLHAAFGAHTGGDALNLGMRFGGHRWLHDAQSLARLASACGFEAVPTSCAKSTVGKFDGLNLRDESGSLSFATDLVKRHAVARHVLAPIGVAGAALVEDVGGIPLYAATAARPTVTYRSPAPLDARALACINIRSANVSSFDEHSLKSLVVDDRNAGRPWWFDETLKSRIGANIVTGDELRVAIGDAPSFSELHFSPAATAGELFTLGPAEVFVLQADK